MGNTYGISAVESHLLLNARFLRAVQMPGCKSSRQYCRANNKRYAGLFGVYCLSAVQALQPSRIVLSLPAGGCKQAILGPLWWYAKPMASKQNGRPSHLVEIPPTCLAAPQMQPHVDARPDRRRTLHVVGHQFAHVATSRHALRPFRQPVRILETRHGPMHYGHCADHLADTSPSSALHASDRVR
jgi:hypothetical protein